MQDCWLEYVLFELARQVGEIWARLNTRPPNSWFIFWHTFLRKACASWFRTWWNSCYYLRSSHCFQSEVWRSLFFKWGLLSLVLQFISSGVQQAHNNTEKRSYQSLFSHLGLYLVKWGHFHGLTLVFILLFWVWWLDWACPQGSGKHQWRSGQSFLLRKGWKSHWNSIIRSLKSHLWSER